MKLCRRVVDYFVDVAVFAIGIVLTLVLAVLDWWDGTSSGDPPHANP